MTRKQGIFRISLMVVFGLLVLMIAVAGAAMTWMDWNRFKPDIEARASAALGRPFAIQGKLAVDWAREPGIDGWRGWVPWPRLSAENLSLGNSDWARTPVMVSLERVQLSLSPLPLLEHRVVIRDLQLTGLTVNLQRLADGRANWALTLPGSDKDGAKTETPWAVDIDQIGFDQGTISYSDASLKADVTARIDPLGKPVPFAEIAGEQTGQLAGPVPRDYVFGWKATGRYHGLPFKGEGRIGGMLALSDANQPFPVQAQVEIGHTRASVVGILTDPEHLGALNLRLSLSGASLADLYPLTGVTLPDTPPYSTDGHLVASLRGADDGVFDYRDFNGKVGQSDLHGSLRFASHPPRAKLSGQLWSKQLRMADLGPLIGIGAKGGDSAEPNAAAADARAASGKVLPASEFRTDRWRDMDADVTFSGDRIQHGGRLPLSGLNTHIVMDGGKLTVDPLRFGVAGGTITGAIRLDGSQMLMSGQLQLAATALRLKQLFPDMHTPEAQGMLGQLRGNVSLSGRGNSVAALLGSADGEVYALVNDGVVSRSLMEIAGLNIGNYLMTKLFGDEDVKINCAAVDLNVKRGILNTRAAIIDTENSLVDVKGTASLRDETLDLTVSPESKGFRLFSLRSPLYVRGNFAHPQAGVEVGPLLARGVGLVALSLALTPAAGLLALVAGPSGEEDSQPKQCVDLMAKARAKTLNNK